MVSKENDVSDRVALITRAMKSSIAYRQTDISTFGWSLLSLSWEFAACEFATHFPAYGLTCSMYSEVESPSSESSE